MVDILGPLFDAADRFRAGREERHKTDMRIADKASPLCRTLKASFEQWPTGPRTTAELTAWARRFGDGYAATEPALQEIVDLRPDASRSVRTSVKRARDAYYAAADIVIPLVGATYWGPLAVSDHEADVKLRKAFAYLHTCISKLAAVSLIEG